MGPRGPRKTSSRARKISAAEAALAWALAVVLLVAALRAVAKVLAVISKVLVKLLALVSVKVVVKVAVEWVGSAGLKPRKRSRKQWRLTWSKVGDTERHTYAVALFITRSASR